jgi:hypothetical protein
MLSKVMTPLRADLPGLFVDHADVGESGGVAEAVVEDLDVPMGRGRCSLAGGRSFRGF